jgi:hypothetical protein
MSFAMEETRHNAVSESRLARRRIVETDALIVDRRNETGMKKTLSEIEIAARWWRDALASSATRSRSAAPAVASSPARCLAVLTERQLDDFETALREELLAVVEKHWDPTRPLWGASVRTLDVNGRPCPILAKAAAAAGIEDPESRFPPNVTMWIDPGQVSVRKWDEPGMVILYRER